MGIRKTFHKYLHPKEAFIGNGCLNEEFVKVANGTKKDEANKPGKYSRKYRDTKDDLTHRDENGGLKFVYPYGSTINVRKPSVALLSSGPISFPANRPVGAVQDCWSCLRTLPPCLMRNSISLIRI